MGERQNKIDPAMIPAPYGFRKLERGEPLKKGDLYLHLGTFDWLSVSTVPGDRNFYTNCIRPIKFY